jgi:hypothetical protein
VLSCLVPYIGCHGKSYNSFFFALKVNIMSVLITVVFCLCFNDLLVSAQKLGMLGYGR